MQVGIFLYTNVLRCSFMKRFNEEEKAQYFIGYLAAFPAKEETGGQKSSEQICVAQNEIGDGFQKQ